MHAIRRMSEVDRVCALIRDHDVDARRSRACEEALDQPIPSVLRGLAQILHQLLGRPRQVLKLRAQITSLRFAQGSRIRERSRSASTARSASRPPPAPRQCRRRRPPSGRSHRNPATAPGTASACRAARRVSRYAPASAVAFVSPTKSRSGDLLEIDLAAAGEIAAPRRHQHQPIFAERKSLEVSGSACSAAKPRSAAPLAIARGDIGALAFLDVDIDVGMFAQERGQRLRQMLRQARRVGEQMDAGPDAAGKGWRDRPASSRPCA